jgi:glucose/arabinose dehydrogenase
MLKPRSVVGLACLAAALAICTSPAGGDDDKKLPLTGKTPTELPRIPAPDPKAAQLPPGFAVVAAVTDLTYPSSIEFDDKGAMYVAEAGYNYGDEVAPARVKRITRAGPNQTVTEVVADQLNGPVTDILWHKGRLYISHRGKISVLESGKLRDLVTGLPSLGDHHNNGLAAGPDGKIYFGQGTATNSGVVGLDNFLFGWLQKYPDVHDIPAKDIKLRDQTFETPDPVAMLTKGELTKTRTAAFHPFGRKAESTTVKGQVKANGTILRMDADGSNLEVYAWGLRNPYGLGFTPDGKLLCTDAGMDERGSRPIANAPDCLWEIKQGAWYGFPDYAGGEPVTDPKFRSKRGPAPQFLLADHPEVQKPLLAVPPHTGGTKFDLSRGGPFGKGLAYVALMGDMTPSTGEKVDHPGFAVARMDLTTLKPEPFFQTRKDALGPKGFEYVATPGPRRPVDVKFAPDGLSLFVVDVGAMTDVPTALGPVPRPFPGTGVVWHIFPVK